MRKYNTMESDTHWVRYKFSTGYQKGKVLSKRFFINVLLVGNSIHAHITTLNQQMYRPYKVNLSRTGVDYSGSLNFKNVFYSGGVEEDDLYKSYIVIYPCASARGVVLDLVPYGSAETFVNSLCKFIFGRGCP